MVSVSLTGGSGSDRKALVALITSDDSAAVVRANKTKSIYGANITKASNTTKPSAAIRGRVVAANTCKEVFI